mgnify:FL=1
MHNNGIIVEPSRKHKSRDLRDDLLLLMIIMEILSDSGSEDSWDDAGSDSGHGNGGRNDRDGDCQRPHEESCDFEFGECANRAEYAVGYATDNGRGDREVMHYYCKKHYLLKLHWIIDSMETNACMADQRTERKIRQAIRAYISSFGRYGS